MMSHITIVTFKLDGVKDIIVVTDNLEQDFGKFRIKDGGSAMYR